MVKSVQYNQHKCLNKVSCICCDYRFIIISTTYTCAYIYVFECSTKVLITRQCLQGAFKNKFYNWYINHCVDLLYKMFMRWLTSVVVCIYVWAVATKKKRKYVSYCSNSRDKTLFQEATRLTGQSSTRASYNTKCVQPKLSRLLLRMTETWHI